ncbi:hypothetical protein ACH5RR_041815 [Cinchona calisaya]|uniref:Homer protein n=1 Tax=Cinchona calisaya TaxID=153742 RepID=A0ABD2Y033_9GENT
MGSSIITTALSSSSISCLNLKTHLTQRFYITKFSNISSFSATRIASLIAKCSSKNQSEKGSNLKDVLSGMVDERVEQLLSNEENRVLLDGLEKATQRVERAKRELAEIERQEAEAKLLRDYVNKLQSTTSEIAECQKEILEAKAMVEEAERSLNGGGVGAENSFSGMESQSVNKDEERLESIKAAIISAIVGTIAGLPFSLTRATGISDLIFPLAIAFVSCALFGVTFRYAVRRDLDDIHLKSGTSAAFGIVKGLATLGAGTRLELDAGNLIPIALDAAVNVSENLLIFFFAGVGLDFCMKLGVLSSFPIDKTISKTNNI